MRILLIAAVLAVGIHAPASASEVPPSVPDMLAVELPADLMDAACATGIGPCDLQMEKLIAAVFLCVVLNIPFLKAIRAGQTIVNALRVGKGLSGLMAVIGSFICTQVWDAYWEWRQCKQNHGLADGAALSQEDWNELADALEDEFAAHGMGWT